MFGPNYSYEAIDLALRMHGGAGQPDLIMETAERIRKFLEDGATKENGANDAT